MGVERNRDIKGGMKRDSGIAHHSMGIRREGENGGYRNCIAYEKRERVIQGGMVNEMVGCVISVKVGGWLR